MNKKVKLLISIFNLYYILFSFTVPFVLGQDVSPTPDATNEAVSLVPTTEIPTISEPTTTPDSSPDPVPAEPQAVDTDNVTNTIIPDQQPSPSDAPEVFPSPSLVPETLDTTLSTACTELTLPDCIQPESTISAQLTTVYEPFIPLVSTIDVNRGITALPENASNTNSSTTANEAGSAAILSGDTTLASAIQSIADATISVTSDANSGSNLILDGNEANLITGDSYSVSNLFSLLNSLMSGSYIGYEQILLAGNQDSTVDLNLLWQKVVNQNLSPQDFMSDEVLVLNFQAMVSQLVAASASSGYNDVTSQNAQTQTGNAGAAANATTVANTVIKDSVILFSSVNVTSDSSGLIILPRPEMFNQNLDLSPTVSLSDSYGKQLFAKLNIFARADSGYNTQTGLFQLLSSGNATANANSLLLGNLLFSGDSLFINYINVNRGWQGNLRYSPDSQNNIRNDSPSTAGTFLDSGNPGGPLGPIDSDMSATLLTTVSAEAISGSNEQHTMGNNILDTGASTAFANFFGLVNSVINRSKVFVSFINVLSPWQGDIAYAYPDLHVSSSLSKDRVNPGESFDLNLVTTNKGTDIAKETRVLITASEYERLDTQPGFSYLGGGIYEWYIGDLQIKESRTIHISGAIDHNFTFKPQSRSSLFIKQAYAQDAQQSVTTRYEAKTSDPEYNTADNYGSVAIIVFRSSENGEPDNRLPKLVANNQHNVNGFVYPGDTVSFTAYVKNESDVTSHDTYAVHSVYSDSHEELFNTRFELGNIDPSHEGRLGFGLRIPSDVFSSGETLHTKLTVYGKAPNGELVASGEIWTSFNVNAGTFGRADQVGWETTQGIVTEVSPDQVLAATDQHYTATKENFIKGWMVALALFLLLILSRIARRKYDLEDYSEIHE